MVFPKILFGVCPVCGGRGDYIPDSQYYPELLSNRSFDEWDGDGNLKGWDNTFGTVERDTDKHSGTYALKTTATAIMRYQLNQFSDYKRASLMGKEITFSCYVKCSVASAAYIYITEDGVTTKSDYHTGSGEWELLTVSQTLSDDGTDGYLGLQVGNPGTIAYYDDVSLLKVIAESEGRGYDLVSYQGRIMCKKCKKWYEAKDENRPMTDWWNKEEAFRRKVGFVDEIT